MDKEDVVHNNGIVFSYKKEWNLAICENRDGVGGYYAIYIIISQTEKDKHCMISLIRGI